jgi:signal peptidase
MKKTDILQNNKKILTYTISIIIGLIILFTIILPVIQGSLHFLTVLSGSMSPSINAGDVVVTQEQSSSSIITGDIITFQESNNQNKLVTHRVVNISERNNTLFFETKGDANQGKDQQLVSENELVGKVIFTIPYLGYLPNFVKSPTGFLLLIVIPGILLITSESRKIYQNVKQKNNSVKNDEKKNT